MQANEILKLIEEVDPQDSAKLDEIDARVFCYIGRHVYKSHVRIDHGVLVNCQFSDEGRAWTSLYAKNYTRSRDALKAIRPEGCVPVKLYQDGNVFRFELWKTGTPWLGNRNIAQSAWLPTEELAELHAIIQAIAHERSQK